jgi:uncharacterized protein YcfJ
MNASRARLVAATLLLAAACAQAAPPEENVTYAYAQVLRASPIYAMQRVRVPEERCEPGREGGTGGTVAGAVVGGALGNQVGKGDGRKAATVAGAVLGGAIGRRMGRDERTRCRTVEVEREERRLVGYDVEYSYKGETYMSRVAADPGNRLRIRVSVTPAEPGR